MPDFKGFGGWKFLLVYVVILIIGMSLFNYVFLNKMNPAIDFSEFKSRISTGEIKRVEITESYFTGFTNPDKKESSRTVPRSYGSHDKVYRTVSILTEGFIDFLDAHNVSYGAVSREGNAVLNFIFSWVLPIAFFIFIWRFVFKRLGNMGGNVLSIGQNRAVIVAEGDIVTRFSDVAGVDEAKEELVEVVDFLKNPQNTKRLAARYPRECFWWDHRGREKLYWRAPLREKREFPFSA